MRAVPVRATTDRRDIRVLHLIHETAFGGVESAAENLRCALGTGRTGAPAASDAPNADVRYRLAALEASPTDVEVAHADVAGHGVNSPAAALRLLRVIRRTRPEVVVTSLWRTVALGPLIRLVSPGTRWAIWVHLPRYTHRIDELVHRLLLPRADAVLCDAEATYETLVRPELERAGREVPVRIVRPAAAHLPLEQPPAPPAEDEPLRLIFWGRMARQKRLDRAIDLLAELRERRPAGAELLIVGPDAGEHDALVAHAAERGVADHVRFEPPMGREALARRAAGFHVFVQLSESEGFAMSAHEALVAAFVTVLTPVGELAADTEDGVSSLHHHDDVARTAQRLLELTADPEAFAAMGRAAAGMSDPGFVDAFARTCRELAGGIVP